jgi:dienelactone hydrolase
MKKWSILFLLLFSPFLQAALQEKTVEYKSGDTTMKGYLVWDDKVKGKRPGVLVVHEFWGLNDYARHRARMLAELGYTALALDMYGDGKVGQHPREASEFMQAVLSNADVAKSRFLAGKEFLERQPTVDPTKIGAIGYCFGGGTVLMMARAGVDLAAVVSFHGLLNAGAPAKPGQVRWSSLTMSLHSSRKWMPQVPTIDSITSRGRNTASPIRKQMRWPRNSIYRWVTTRLPTSSHGPQCNSYSKRYSVANADAPLDQAGLSAGFFLPTF